MLKLRLKRVGRKNINAFRIVVVDSRKKRDTNDIVEDLGYYQPYNKKEYFRLNLDRVDYWVNLGGEPTIRVNKLINICRSNSEFMYT